MKLKILNKDFFKKNIVITSSIIFSLSSSSCNYDDNYVISEYSLESVSITSCADISVPFIYIDNGVYDKELLNKLNSDNKVNNCYGLILKPSSVTYSSIYKDIDLIKDILKDNKVSAPILYDIDKLMSDEYLDANCKLAHVFLDKIKSNNISTGIYGSKDNIDKFINRYNEIIGDSFSYLIIVDGENYSELYNVIENIIDNNLNNKDYFLTDYEYVVREGDNLYSIAESYNMKLSDLMDYNNMSEDSLIVPGDKIIIPSVYNKTITKDNNVNINDCKIGIDISEYNCYVNGQRFNYELTDEIKNKIGIEKLELLYDVNDYNDDIYFTENVYDHLQWNAIKENVDFVSIRIGDFWLSDNNEVIFDEDEEFKYNLESCISKGIPYFTYYVSSNNTIEGQVKESEYIMKMLLDLGYDTKHPVFIDIEPSTYLYNDLFVYNKSSISSLNAGISSIKNNGFNTGIYCSEDLKNKLITLDEFKNYDFWSTCTSSYNTTINLDEFNLINFMNSNGCYPTEDSPIIQLSCKGKSYIVPLSLNEDNGLDVDVASKKFVKKLY